MKSTDDPQIPSDIYRRVFHASSIPMAISTVAEGRYLDINESGARACGMKREDMIGRTSVEVGIYPDSAVRDTVRGEISSGNSVNSVEMQLSKRDGTPIISLMYFDLLDDNQELWLTSGVDISRLKTVETALRASEERFRKYVEHANDIIYSLTSEGVFTYVSPNWTEFLGHTVDEVVGRSFEDFVHPDDIPACHRFLELIIARGKSERSVPYRVLHKDGTWRRHSSNATMSSGNGSDYTFIGIARDMTDQLGIERELEAMRIASQREEERIAIARDLHDDLSQELTGLHIELASLSRTAADLNTRKRLALLKDELGKTIATVRGILAELRSDVLDELGLEGAVRWLARNLRRKSGITCRIDCAMGLYAPSQMTATAIYRIIQEALNNIVRHSRASIVRIRLNGSIEQLRITITDNGIGMSDGSDDCSGHYGIAGMRERARLCGGTLEFSRPPGGGTRIVAKLPAGV